MTSGVVPSSAMNLGSVFPRMTLCARMVAPRGRDQSYQYFGETWQCSSWNHGVSTRHLCLWIPCVVLKSSPGQPGHPNFPPVEHGGSARTSTQTLCQSEGSRENSYSSCGPTCCRTDTTAGVGPTVCPCCQLCCSFDLILQLLRCSHTIFHHRQVHLISAAPSGC